MEKKRLRNGEVDALYFDQMLPRCKEMFFEYISHGFNSCRGFDRSVFPDIIGFPDQKGMTPIEAIFDFAVQLIAFDRGIYLPLESQAHVTANGKNYIADFLFDTEGYFAEINTCEKQLKLVVECDGHDFHEKTKEQVKKRNNRDYDLKMSGYDVLHFSGSEIFNEPFVCASKAIDYILDHTGEWKGCGE